MATVPEGMQGVLYAKVTLVLLHARYIGTVQSCGGVCCPGVRPSFMPTREMRRSRGASLRAKN